MTAVDLVHVHASRVSARIAAISAVHVHVRTSRTATRRRTASRNGER